MADGEARSFRDILADESVTFDELVAAARSAPPSGVISAIVAALHAELQWERRGAQTGEPPPTVGAMAAELAGELQLAGAIDALIDCVATFDCLDPLGQRAADALVRIGAAAVDPLLAAHDAAPEESEGRGNLAGAIIELAARRRPLTPQQHGRVEEIRSADAAEAHEVFAGDEDELDFAEREWAQAKALGAEELGLPSPATPRGGTPARRNATLPRNAPCRCGSGKKYKKCCLASDEATERAGDGPPSASD